MPFIRSLVFKRRAHAVIVILLLSEIMPSCSCCNEKKLVYIIIIAPFGCQPSFYFKCTKLSMCLSCNVRSVSDAECLYFMHSYSLQSL